MTARLLLISSLLLLTAVGYTQDSVKATILRTAEHEVIYEINKMRFVSFDCKCSSFKRGDVFMIPKERFDSLLLQAKPVRKRQSS